MNAEEILELVRAGGLLAPTRPVLVLLSGGRDSVCLLDLAVRIAGPGAVRALHVNYALRPDAGEDERYCADLCGALDVPLAVERPPGPPGPGGNVQAWAREIRYAAAARIAEGADVATGHTATDQVEGVLYRLAAAPSRRALLGMREHSGQVVRPLLGVTREQTGAYCRERGLAWREDATNAERLYARGRVRGDLVPVLRSIHPGAEANVLALVEILRDEAEVLDSVLDEVLAGRREIELARLRELPRAVRRLAVQRLADLAAGGPAPGAAARAEEIAALADRGSATLHLGGSLRAVAEYGVLHFERHRAPESKPPGTARLPVPGAVGFGAFEVRCELGPPEPRPGAVDRAALGTELVVRAWRPGDRMAPLGLGGTKSLQDLFTARRVARARRATIPVVESGREIVWVAGVATSERFRVTERTREAAFLSAVET